MPKHISLVDPNGLLEYSVVFTERSLIHVSVSFQDVMVDISVALKKVFSAHSVAFVPGGGTYAMEAVARQYATNKKTFIIRNGWFSYRWTQILEMINIPTSSTVIKASPITSRSQAAFGFDRIKGAQKELGLKVLSLLNEKQFRSVAAEGFEAPSVMVYYTDDIDIHSGKKFADFRYANSCWGSTKV